MTHIFRVIKVVKLQKSSFEASLVLRHSMQRSHKLSPPGLLRAVGLQCIEEVAVTCARARSQDFSTEFVHVQRCAAWLCLSRPRRYTLDWLTNWHSYYAGTCRGKRWLARQWGWGVCSPCHCKWKEKNRLASHNSKQLKSVASFNESVVSCHFAIGVDRPSPKFIYSI